MTCLRSVQASNLCFRSGSSLSRKDGWYVGMTGIPFLS